MWITHSRPINQDVAVKAAFGQQPTLVKSFSSAKRCKKHSPIWLGWGQKPSTNKARQWAEKLNIDFHQLEDGFICYRGHPAKKSQRLSLIHDKTGIYYDAKRKCDLDAILENLSLTPQQDERITQIIEKIKRFGISKYNHQKLNDLSIQPIDKNAVILIDQIQGDASIKGALAGYPDFENMVSNAFELYPDRPIYAKIHPDVILGKKKSFLQPLLKHYPRLKILPEVISIQSLFTNKPIVYTVSSQLGLEALLYDCQVHCFGVPFYASRGLTIDYKKPLYNRKKVSLKTLSYAALIDYCYYIHPETHQNCEIETLLDFLIIDKQFKQKIAYKKIYCIDFSFWKRLFLKTWFMDACDKVIFTSLETAKNNASQQDAIVVWSNQHLDLQHQHIIRIEDGFVRSKGLGIDLTPPLSLVMDVEGIYFDSTKPSSLENLLNTLDISKADTKRASDLIELINIQKVSKYNLSQPPFTCDIPANKKIILVPGQVDNDASIRFGSNRFSIATMLKQVRELNPHAFIIFRPHPDVLTGERTGLSISEAKKHADLIDIGTDLYSVIDRCDEIHVLTSLVGFESLLRQKTVVCYGNPFYAGWNLTKDMDPIHRRNNKRTLEELAYIALVAYPFYLHPLTQQLTSIESIIAVLTADKSSVKTGVGYWHRLWKKVSALVKILANNY